MTKTIKATIKATPPRCDACPAFVRAEDPDRDPEVDYYEDVTEYGDNEFRPVLIVIHCRTCRACGDRHLYERAVGT